MKIQSVIILFLGLVACQPKVQKESSTQNPNIVFLFADDYTYEAIHALGNQTVQTPNLDKLVHSGTTLTHAYNMGGWHGAVCVASRSMIISGASLWRSREVEKQWENRDSTALSNTWGRLMQAQGYNTYMTGKWHIKAPADSVFRNTRNIRPGMPPDYWNNKAFNAITAALKNGDDIYPKMPIGYHRPMDKNDKTWSAADTTHSGFWQGGKHWSEVVKDDALDFISDASKENNPFFMYLAFNAPHDPRQAPQSFLDQYSVDSIPLPVNWLSEYPFKDGIGNTPALRDEALAPFPRTPFAIKTHLMEYYAIISHLDEQIGQILDALEASGKMDNTYIFFTGDHGLSVGHHGLLGKQNLFDHSVRVPLIVKGPGVKNDHRIHSDVYLQDIMATSLDLAKIEKPHFVEFKSFLPQIIGTSIESSYQNGIYGAYMNYQRMIRKDDYKLLIYPKINKILLFDLIKDPEEMYNLADQPEYSEKRNALFSDLVKLQREMNDPLDLSILQASLN